MYRFPFFTKKSSNEDILVKLLDSLLENQKTTNNRLINIQNVLEKIEEIQRDIRKLQVTQCDRLFPDLLSHITLTTQQAYFAFPYCGQEVRFFLPYLGFDYIQNEIVKNATFYEEDLLRFVRSKYFNKLKKSTVIDVGANIGNHTVFFAKFCDSNVISYEPQPAIFNILLKNLKINGIKAKANNFALGGKSGSLSIKNIYNPFNTGGTSYQYSDMCNTSTFVRTLEQEKIEQCDFIKIDVEGFEIQVLEGARGLIKRFKPTIWLESFESNFKSVDDYMRESGYKLTDNLPNNNYVYTYVFAK